MIEEIRQALLPIIESYDCYLDDLVYEQEKNDMYLRVFIEKNEGSLDMDTCTAVSEAVSEKLDEIDIIKDEYYLEVSSPGIEEPLRSLAEIQKHTGDYVHMELKQTVNGLSEIEGILEETESQIKVQYFVKGVKKHLVTEYENIKFMRLAVKF